MIDIATYRARLEEERKKLEEELESVGRRNPSNKADWEAEPQTLEQEADPTDVATQFDRFADNAAILQDLEVRYQEVLAALARIEEGTYGVCEVSGEPIEAERLNADPAARTTKAHMK